jgi:hypothetical protein
MATPVANRRRDERAEPGRDCRQPATARSQPELKATIERARRTFRARHGHLPEAGRGCRRAAGRPNGRSAARHTLEANTGNS